MDSPVSVTLSRGDEIKTLSIPATDILSEVGNFLKKISRWGVFL